MNQYKMQSKNITNLTYEQYFTLLSRIEILEEENNLLTHERDLLKKEKEGFLISRSWLITKPLRAFTDFFRHLKKQRKKSALSLSDVLNNKKTEIFSQKSKVFSKQIKFSIISILHNTPKNILINLIRYVISQTYSNWELLLIDESDDKHKYIETICKSYIKKNNNIKYIKLLKDQKFSDNFNESINNSSADYTGILCHNALLHPSALFELMNVICDDNADFIYTDEAEYFNKNITFRNHKPDFAIDTLRSCNYIGQFSVFSKVLAEKAGISGMDILIGNYYDLILRLTDKASKIKHIPKLLYFTNSNFKTDALNVNDEIALNKKAILSSLKRHEISAEIECTEISNSIFRLKYELTEKPLVSIIILNKDNIYILDKCIRSILEKSTYDNFEIIIVENNSTEDITFAYYEELKIYNNIHILYWKEKGFNYSELNNFAYQHTKGKHLIFLNNDIEIITPNWIEEMLMYSQRDDVGAVGIKLYYPDNSIQHAGSILCLGGIVGNIFYNAHRNAPSYNFRLHYVQNLSVLVGACIMIKSAVFSEIIFFDINYKIFLNDTDLCMKIRKKNYLIVWTPFAEVYHYESKTLLSSNLLNEIQIKYEKDLFLKKWSRELSNGDPYYNCNFSLKESNYTLR